MHTHTILCTRVCFLICVCTYIYMQVEIEVEACDKGGNFIGWLYSEGRNLSIALLEVCVKVFAAMQFVFYQHILCTV